MTTTLKPIRSLRPTLDTLFHIDYTWWNKDDRDLRLYLRSHLCAEHRAQLAGADLEGDMIDWIDPNTAEVKRTDALVLLMRTHCAHQADFIGEHTGIVDAAFRVFLTNDNQPLNSRQIAEQIDRDADTVLRTIGGKQIYQGIRFISG
jgi:hypothetical protein